MKIESECLENEWVKCERVNYTIIVNSKETLVNNKFCYCNSLERTQAIVKFLINGTWQFVKNSKLVFKCSFDQRRAYKSIIGIRS